VRESHIQIQIAPKSLSVTCLASDGSITSPTKPSPTKQDFNQLRLVSGTAALLCLVASPDYQTTSQLEALLTGINLSPGRRPSPDWRRAQAVFPTDGRTRLAPTRDLLQRLPGETPYEEVIIRERCNGPSGLSDNDVSHHFKKFVHFFEQRCKKRGTTEIVVIIVAEFRPGPLLKLIIIALKRRT